MVPVPLHRNLNHWVHRRHFMPAMLMFPGNRGWPAFQGLLRGLLRFLEPYLRNAQLTEAVRLLYKVQHGYLDIDELPIWI